MVYVDVDGAAKRRKPLAPNQAGIKGQGREGQRKARKSPNWKPHNNTPPSTPPKHTPGRGHRKHTSKRKGIVDIKLINATSLASSEFMCALTYENCLARANRNYEANLELAYMKTDLKLQENSIQLAERILKLDLLECGTTYVACGLSCLLPYEIFNF